MASLREEPRPGDLIEINRTGYKHWALYEGNGYVIHLTSPDDNPGSGSVSIGSARGPKGVVKRDLLINVLGSSDYRVNNYLDHKHDPLPVKNILRAAQEMIGKECDYNLLKKNCEHFVTSLRYNKPSCKEAETFMMWLKGAIGLFGFAFVLKTASAILRH